MKTDRIEISGVRCVGIHGVLESEKLKPQEFAVDVSLIGDLSRAALSDDLNDTLDYSKAADLIKSEIGGKHCDLLETLAGNIANRLKTLVLSKSVLINEIAVTVTKINPPISQVASVSCEVRHSVKRDVYLSLGSNLFDRLGYLRNACRMLPDVVDISSIYSTVPQGENTDLQGPYLNCALKLETAILPYDLLKICQEIEFKASRQRFYKNSARTLDIDILMYGLVTSDDPVLTLPHPRIKDRPFVIEPLSEIIDEAVMAKLDLPSSSDLGESNEKKQAQSDGLNQKKRNGVKKLGKLIL